MPARALPEEIDRKALRTAQARFRAVSGARLERVRAMLGERARAFVDLLPLLLHANHPALPGYVSQHTPHGVSGYRPDAATLALARRSARSFTHHPGAATDPGVHAIWLMGSTGTLGHSDASDLDVWICYPESLDGASLAQLQRKAELLAEWARGQGLDAHLFLMNGEKFRRGQREPLTGENCGTAQHYLLLDEFYRTGILLAGRQPAWWLVPPECEDVYPDYVAELQRRRHVRTQDLVDFGGIREVPAGEFAGAGIWQLYKAIDSPYKSVLKLLLFEVYAANFPRAECLSGDFKRAVYAGVTDIDELDPYVMIYRRLEAHLLRAGQPERLELVRRSLYYKAGKKLSRPPQHGVASWQRLLMERLTADWGWDRAVLARLDAHAGWDIREVAAERNALVRELTLSYRALADFAREGEAAASIDAREFDILGRKLYAAYERRAGKVECLVAGAAADVAEPEISVCALPPAGGGGEALLWGAYPELIAPRGSPEQRPLRQAACLSELLAWCVVNGVIGERTRLAVREPLDGLGHAELDGMLREIRAHVLPARAGAARDEAAFSAPARTLGLLVFVNVAADPLATARARGVQRVSSRTDSLGYSAMRENLVLNIETLGCNSWGEVVAARYGREEGLLRCAREFLQLGELHAPPAVPVVIRCFCASRAAPIAARIEELFADLREAFHGPGAAPDARYVLSIGGRLHLLCRRNGVVEARSADMAPALLELLGAPQPAWCSLRIDRHALRDSPLPALAARLAPGQVAVFCESRSDGPEVIVADERGSLFASRRGGLREDSALAALAHFLVSVRFRQGAGRHAAGGVVGTPPRFYRLTREHSRGEYEATPLPDPPRAIGTALHVQAIAEPASDSERVFYTVWCEGASFSQRELGERFHAELAAHIVARRGAGEAYPVYLSDLDLSALEATSPEPLQTLHYLRHRETLEAAINAALRAHR
jgi:adenylate cyclase class 1